MEELAIECRMGYVTGWRINRHVFFHDLPTKAGDVGFWSGHAIAPSGFLPRVVPRPHCRRLSWQHPARLPAHGHPEHGPRRHPRTRRDEIERSQDA
jgi:hypothetical protein